MRHADGPLSIGLLTWEYPPASSGLPRAAREVAQALAGAGHDVRVLTLDRDGRERDGEVEVIGRRVDPASLAGRVRRRAGVGHLVGPHALRSLALRAHRERPFDVLEATNWFAPGLLVALRGPVPLVTRASTPATIGKGARAGVRDRLDGAFLDRLERRSARASAGLISNTAPHRERIRRFYGLSGDELHEAIAPPVDPDTLAAGRAASYPEGDDGRVGLLFVGRPDRRKGFDAIADALVELAGDPRAPAFTLRLVGTDEAGLPEPLRAGPARALVEPLGRVDDAAVLAELERAHAVLAPSRSESFGYVYQEALAFGRPLVCCAEDASAREFVGEPGAGLLAPRCTGADVARASRRVAAEPALRAELRAKALAAAGRCTREACAAATVAVYRRVLADRAGRSAVRAADAPDATG